MSRTDITPNTRWAAAALAIVFLGCVSAGTVPPVGEPEQAPLMEPDEAAGEPQVDLVTLPSPGSPIVAIRLLFKAGSIYDPAGKEGLAALTALMVGNAGTENRSYAELVDALYPMASSIDVQTDREVTVISGEVHREKLDEFTALLTEALLEPAFDEKDLSRNRQQLESFLKSTMRASNDELLGLETLQQAIFHDHPYGHAPAGTVQGLAAITMDDVREFYHSRFTRGALLLGVAGGYPDEYPQQLQEKLSALPVGTQELMQLPAPTPVEGRQFTLVEKRTGSVGIHFGYFLPLNRSHPDYYPLMIANSYLGEHRTFFGRLMKQLRGKRGLNYGDYSYIEYWHLPPFTSQPPPNVPRRQQFFSVWVRPVVPKTAHFALRAALYEVERLINRGLTEEEFEDTRAFVTNYSKLWAQTLPDRLGFHLDSRYYETDYFIDEIEERLSKLTVEDVNRAIRKYIQTRDFHAVLVTDKAADVRAYLTSEDPSPLEYNNEPEPEVLEADKDIIGIPVQPAGFVSIPVDRMFESGESLR